MTNQVNNQRHKYHPLSAQYHNDSEIDDRSGCRNVSHCHQQFFSQLHSPDHTTRTTDTPGFKPFTIFNNIEANATKLGDFFQKLSENNLI